MMADDGCYEKTTGLCMNSMPGHSQKAFEQALAPS